MESAPKISTMVMARWVCSARFCRAVCDRLARAEDLPVSVSLPQARDALKSPCLYYTEQYLPIRYSITCLYKPKLTSNAGQRDLCFLFPFTGFFQYR